MDTWTRPAKPAHSIGLIGTGVMGRCMLEKIIQAGYAVTIYDKFPSSLRRAEEIGGTAAATPFELAQKSDLILFSLPGPVQVDEIVFGENGIIDALRPGQVVIDTSTVDPETTKKAGAGIEEKGAAYLDSPILGRPSAVGKWLLPTGGSKEAAGYAEPVLLTFASKIIHVGELGAGNALKLLNQMMYSTINAITSEVMAISDRVGVKKELFYETVAGSSAATVSGLFREVGKNIVERDYDHPAFTVDLLIKDTSLALKMTRDAKAPSFIAGYVQMYNELASANGLGGKDVSALYEVYNSHYRKEN